MILYIYIYIYIYENTGCPSYVRSTHFAETCHKQYEAILVLKVKQSTEGITILK